MNKRATREALDSLVNRVARGLEQTKFIVQKGEHIQQNSKIKLHIAYFLKRARTQIFRKVTKQKFTV